MFKIWKILILILLFLVFSVGELSGEYLSLKDKEIEMLRKEFIKRMGNAVEIGQDYQNKIFQTAVKRLSESGISEDQYFLYVDRNPERQVIFVCFFDSKNKKIIEIGRDKTSTGNPYRRGAYFFTPTGIFRNTIEIPNYRALGTENEEGWRGLGKKGSRVWDFGWQESYKIINKRKKFVSIRLLMHATDPDFGEKRLGEPDSKGCIRISGKLNEFLDHFGIIDKDYERHNHWLLKKDREPVFYQGEYLLVGDSSESK